MIKEITIPEISENVESGTVVNVLVSVGDTVEVDDPIIELETDKAVVEIPTPHKGIINELLVAEGDEVKIGQVIAKVETDTEKAAEKADAADKDETRRTEVVEPSESETGAAEQAEPAEEKQEAKRPADDGQEPRERRKETPPAPEPPKADDAPESRKPVPASPSVRRLARELGVDIGAVEAGRPGERLTEADIKAHVKKIQAPAAPASRPTASQAVSSQPALPDFGKWGEIESIDLSTVRRITAESVSVSWNVVPHVTQFDSADITVLQEYMRANKKRVERAGGRLTLTPMLMKACAEALLKFPRFNASIDSAANQLILKHYVHIGLMVDTPRGLLVPVIRNADRKSITELAVEISDLAERARNKKVKPDELEGGTFSISNQGVIGGTGFTPIVLWPQAAILGVSRTAVEPRYIEGEFKPREILPLSLSYDHRIIDGADAARFLRWICDSLEYPLAMHME